ncbi:MAG: mechanosensitive ion channel family protein [Bacilli bacterium]|nr:mechanosensitive ion channel family protein [Bacilli bacterium]
MDIKSFFEYFVKHNYHLIIIYIIVGYIVYQILSKVIKKGTSKIKTKRGATIATIIKHILKYAIAIIVLIAILNELGINVTSMLAGVGIIGVVIGLSLQDIMKDYLVGFSIVFEEQYDVGDYVEINGHAGTIKKLNLKTTTMQTFENVIITIPNRMVTEVINYSQKNLNLLVSIPMPYDVETKKADKIVESIAKRLEKEEDVTDKVDILSFCSFEDSYIKYKIGIPVKNEAQFEMRRKANRIIKEEYDKAGISIPFNIIEVKNG